MIINDFLKRLGVDSLSDMQKAAGEAIMNGDNDVVLLSPTGSGKTLAYLLPIVQMVNQMDDRVQCVVIVPGRELALQSANVLNDMKTGLRCCACYGGRMAMEEHRTLRQVCPHIVFATPGRLNDHLDKHNISSDGIRYVVIDEFDKCLEMGFADEMSAIMGKLPNVGKRILLSATDIDSIPHFVNMRRMVRLDYLDGADIVAERLKIYKVAVPVKDKLETLSSLLRTFGNQSSIVFVNYRESVERVDAYLHSLGFVTSAYHGGLDQREREDAIYKFSNGSASVLVSTDLASRGLDIPFVENIIHYHLPETEDNYIHRTGRTARWDAHGRAFFLLSPSEKLPDYVESDMDVFEIPDVLLPVAQPKNATVYIGKGKQSKISKGDIVGFLCKKAGLKAADIGRIDIKDRYSYVAVERSKLRQVLRMANGEKIKGVKTVVEEVN